MESDLKALGVDDPRSSAASPGTRKYAARIADAAREEREPGAPPLLLGHFYTRYLADLFGGSMLGWPTKRALGLAQVPAFYEHGEAVSSDRRAYVESVYEALNEAGEGLDDAGRAAVAREAERAFALNALVYKEGPGGAGAGMTVMAALGGLNALGGYARERFVGAVPPRDIFGRIVRRRKSAFMNDEKE